MRVRSALALAIFFLGSCSSPPEKKPSILLVTLDTTRADSIGPGAAVKTHAFDALASSGIHFRQAYATVPETLPSHLSMMTGLYPAGHGVHENGRFLPASFPVAAEKLKQAGYRTGAVVSAFVLEGRFGLARGFDQYDDRMPNGRVERSAEAATDAAIAQIRAAAGQPLFLWVHYYDAHAPYAPPQRFREQYAGAPYLGEIAAVDEQMGRLVGAFKTRDANAAIIVAADHGEGLGDHGEKQHGNLIYQSTMHVPLVVTGPSVTARTIDAPVSTRRIFHTILDFAGIDPSHSLRTDETEVVLGEAMKPFLEYGWQPQVMSIGGRHKAILTARVQGFDVIADPKEQAPLDEGVIPAGVRKAGLDYPIPSMAAARAPSSLTDEDRKRLASLGYVSGTAAPVVRKNAPRPVDMVHLFDAIEQASDLFVNQRYADVIPVLQRIRTEDPFNLDATLRLAVAQSALGRDALAVQMFDKAAELAPESADVRLYRALHFAKGAEWPRAVATLERIVADTPDRQPAVDALASIRARQGLQAMAQGRTPEAIASLEDSRRLRPSAFRNDLELGVLYLAGRRFVEARDALDRFLTAQPTHPMGLFKRAQVSALLREPDTRRRIDLAKQHADATTRPLIASERLFR